MKLSKKSISTVLVGVLSLSMLAGCAPEAVPSPYYVVDEKETVIPYVMKIDDKIISIDEYRSYFMSSKMQFEAMAGGPEIWENAELEAMLKETAESQIKETYAIKKMAKENNITLTEDDKKDVDKIIADVKADFENEEAYQKALTESFLTDEIYKDTIETDKLASKIYEFYFGENGTKVMSEADISKVANEKYAHVKHILIDIDEEGSDVNKKLAQEALAKAKAGEDFDALVKEYGTDPGMEQTPDGYYFTYGEMVKPFEDSSFALKVDEISDIVESDFGYHIIKKYPIEEAYVKANSDKFTEAAYQEIITGILDEAVKSLKIENWEKYDTIGVKTVR